MWSFLHPFACSSVNSSQWSKVLFEGAFLFLFTYNFSNIFLIPKGKCRYCVSAVDWYFYEMLHQIVCSKQALIEFWMLSHLWILFLSFIGFLKPFTYYSVSHYLLLLWNEEILSQNNNLEEMQAFLFSHLIKKIPLHNEFYPIVIPLARLDFEVCLLRRVKQLSRA